MQERDREGERVMLALVPARAERKPEGFEKKKCLITVVTNQFIKRKVALKG